jgi:hypothetical protein
MRLAFTWEKPVSGDLAHSAGSRRTISAVALIVCFLAMLAYVQLAMDASRGPTATMSPRCQPGLFVS